MISSFSQSIDHYYFSREKNWRGSNKISMFNAQCSVWSMSSTLETKKFPFRINLCSRSHCSAITASHCYLLRAPTLSRVDCRDCVAAHCACVRTENGMEIQSKAFLPKDPPPISWIHRTSARGIDSICLLWVYSPFQPCVLVFISIIYSNSAQCSGNSDCFARCLLIPSSDFWNLYKFWYDLCSLRGRNRQVAICSRAYECSSSLFWLFITSHFPAY